MLNSKKLANKAPEGALLSTDETHARHEAVSR